MKWTVKETTPGWWKLFDGDGDELLMSGAPEKLQRIADLHNGQTLPVSSPSKSHSSSEAPTTRAIRKEKPNE